MPQSLANILLHIVFSTKDRTQWMTDQKINKDLYAYMATILANIDSPAILINGVDDHVHILCNLSRTLSVMKLVEKVKTEPSKWMKKQGAQYRDFYWQNGYGAFSVSESKSEEVRRYIGDQQEHHKKLKFKPEFRTLCRKNRLKIDERHVWE